MKGKKILLMSLMTVFLLALVGIGNATLTFNMTEVEVNATAPTISIGAASTTMGNITNCTWYVYAAGIKVANTSTTNVWKLTNQSVGNHANQTTLSVDGTANSLQDTTYTLKLTCNNITGASSETATMTSFFVDLSSPTCNTETYATSFSDNDVVDPDATWSMISGNATSAALYFGAGNPRTITSYSFSDRETTWVYSDHVPKTVYDPVYFTISDGTDTTTCTGLRYIDIDRTVGAKKGVIIADLMDDGIFKVAKKGFDPFLVVALVLILYYTGKKKKRR